MGSEGWWVVVLGLMEGDTRFADFSGILDAITSFCSVFEQYHAFTIANFVVLFLSLDERSCLLVVV